MKAIQRWSLISILLPFEAGRSHLITGSSRSGALQTLASHVVVLDERIVHLQPVDVGKRLCLWEEWSHNLNSPFNALWCIFAFGDSGVVESNVVVTDARSIRESRLVCQIFVCSERPGVVVIRWGEVDRDSCRCRETLAFLRDATVGSRSYIGFTRWYKAGNIDGVAVHLCSCDGKSIVAEQDVGAVGHGSVAVVEAIHERIIKRRSLEVRDPISSGLHIVIKLNLQHGLHILRQ